MPKVVAIIIRKDEPGDISASIALKGWGRINGWCVSIGHYDPLMHSIYPNVPVILYNAGEEEKRFTGPDLVQDFINYIEEGEL